MRQNSAMSIGAAALACTCGLGGATEDVFEEINATLGADTIIPTVDVFATPTPTLGSSAGIEESAVDQPELSGDLPVNIFDVDGFTNSSGAFVMYGLVTNDGTEVLDGLTVEAQLFDLEGNVVATTIGSPQFTQLRPGETTPFTVIFTGGAPETAQEYEVVVEGEEAFLISAYSDFSIQNDSASTDSIGSYIITGEATNTGTDNAEFVQIVALAYDAGGVFIGSGFTYVDTSSQAAGETSSFTLYVTEVSGEVASYELLVQGQVY